MGDFDSNFRKVFLSKLESQFKKALITNRPTDFSIQYQLSNYSKQKKIPRQKIALFWFLESHYCTAKIS